MYRLINRHCAAVLETLERGNDVSRYVELRRQLIAQQVNVATDTSFQRLYRDYWGMNRRNAAFCDRYFRLLASCNRSGAIDISRIARELAKVSKTSLEFSFATKLAHMVDPRVPVYDSFVAAFYFHVKPLSEKPFEERLRLHLDFHSFLGREYDRVVRHGLLEEALHGFRSRFQGTDAICDERVVDWLLWAWASMLRGGAQRQGDLLYD